jgi:hypothetical protein
MVLIKLKKLDNISKNKKKYLTKSLSLILEELNKHSTMHPSNIHIWNKLKFNSLLWWDRDQEESSKEKVYLPGSKIPESKVKTSVSTNVKVHKVG